MRDGMVAPGQRDRISLWRWPKTDNPRSQPPMPWSLQRSLSGQARFRAIHRSETGLSRKRAIECPVPTVPFVSQELGACAMAGLPWIGSIGGLCRRCGESGGIAGGPAEPWHRGQDAASKKHRSRNQMAPRSLPVSLLIPGVNTRRRDPRQGLSSFVFNSRVFAAAAKARLVRPRPGPDPTRHPSSSAMGSSADVRT